MTTKQEKGKVTLNLVVALDHDDIQLNDFSEIEQLIENAREFGGILSATFTLTIKDLTIDLTK